VEGLVKQQSLRFLRSSVFLYLLYHEKQIEGVKKVAFELELLVVMDTVENICCNLEQFLDEYHIRHVLRSVVDSVKHFGIAFECFFLKLLIRVDLIAFCLENPAESFRVHVIDIVLI